ncbi:auxin response factor 18-like [Gastrolobium bilobum]|uniref:auxin response factor 18-like n=1 Tax=Gastrolobium bilobum TaxID=150636 RepID=UPI002AAFE05A|nr:auxin response factor 18-like [Gastrolobium bilobum]
MFVVMDSMEKSTERCLDSQLWHACAGAMVQMPPLNTKVFYFPQGHAEHAHGKVDFGQNRVPPLIPCRVSAMKYLADPDTDEVYVKMRLTPLREHELDFEDDCFMGNSGTEGQEKPTSFSKTLTQSDANNGGGFSVPRYCAETIFPKLDYSAEPPIQTIIAKDVHGQCWKFRHIYRGTPRRHLLTTGWSNFVNQKKLVAGDSIVFLRADNGDLCVGIRRAKKGIGGGIEFSSGWNQIAPMFGGGSGFLCGNENKFVSRKGGDEFMLKVAAESVVEAVTCAVNGRPFEVVYYPRASTPEFFVKASSVRVAMQTQWCSGMRFKMPFETEDSSRISWFMGTISSVQVADPIRWPDSPWRLLQVVWDEPDLLQNVKCVNPWLVELVSTIPSFHLSPFSPPRKKQRFLQDPYFHLINQIPMPSFSSNLHNYTNSLCNIQDNDSSAGIQGARHAQLGLTPSDLPFNKLQPDMLFGGFSRLEEHEAQPVTVRPPCGTYNSSTKNNVDISCLLTVGNPGLSFKESNEAKGPHILLFGKLIRTEQKSSNNCSASTTANSVSEGTSLKTSNASDGIGSALNQNSSVDNSSDGGSPWYKDQHKSDLGTENVNTLCMA